MLHATPPIGRRLRIESSAEVAFFNEAQYLDDGVQRLVEALKAHGVAPGSSSVRCMIWGRRTDAWLLAMKSALSRCGRALCVGLIVRVLRVGDAQAKPKPTAVSVISYKKSYPGL